jgi:hypothetical protein
MRTKKSREPKASDQRRSLLGVAWYRQEQWGRLLEISSDRDELENTYEGWEANAEASLPKLTGQGIVPLKIDIDVEELLLRCNSRKCPVDGDARSLFTAEKLREKIGKN